MNKEKLKMRFTQIPLFISVYLIRSVRGDVFYRSTIMTIK